MHCKRAWDRSRPQPFQSINSIWNACKLNLMIESCGKSIQIFHTNLISRRCEIAARRCLRALRLRLLCFEFLSCTLDFRKEVKRWICRVFHALSYHVLTRIFRRHVLEKIDALVFSVKRLNSWLSQTISLLGTLHPPPLPCLHTPLTWAYLFFFGKRLTGVFPDTYGCEKRNSLSCATANFSYLCA